MAEIGLFTLTLILVTVAISYKGFTNWPFFEAYKFHVNSILVKKDYLRLFSSGFLHANWIHLGFNMLTLYFFSDIIEFDLGGILFIFIYFGSLLGGNLFALYIHKQHGNYNAIGASGAVSGVIFASIALNPGMEIGFIILPIHIPSWLYAILYILISIYGIKTKSGNIGHEAHLGGAVVGMLLAILIEPASLKYNYFPIFLALIPTVVFTYLIITKPHFLLVDNFFGTKSNNYYNIDHKYNSQKSDKKKEIDRILDKMNLKGIQSLSKKEMDTLNKYSDDLNN